MGIARAIYRAAHATPQNEPPQRGGIVAIAIPQSI